MLCVENTSLDAVEIDCGEVIATAYEIPQKCEMTRRAAETGQDEALEVVSSLTAVGATFSSEARAPKEETEKELVIKESRSARSVFFL